MEYPWWLNESFETFFGSSVSSNNVDWTQNGEESYSRVRSIHYPPQVHVLFVVDALKENGWEEIPGSHYSEELANNAARKRAYNDKTPHRVRIVVAHE